MAATPELASLATHDQLTGLPNRTLVLDRATHMLERARRPPMSVAALLIDVDDFTSVNDTLGHTAGDALLRALAARLDGVVRDTDQLGRIGDDEFVVLAEELSDGTDAERIAERLREGLRAPFPLAGVGHSGLAVTASIGVATGAATSIESLLRDADVATRRAKRDGGDRHIVFEPGMREDRHSHPEPGCRGARGPRPRSLLSSGETR